MRTLPLILVLGATACASDRVTPADGRAFLKVVNAATHVAAPDDELRLRLLFQGCSEVPSCAAGCERPLSMSAEASVDPDQRGALLAHCFSELRKARDADPSLTPEAWFRRYLGRYAARARASLAADEQQQLDTNVGALGLGRPQ